MNEAPGEYLLSADAIAVPPRVAAKIRRMLASHESFDDAVQSFPFHSFVQAELPELEHLAAALGPRLERESRFVIVNNLPFASFELPVCKFLVLALATCLGKPRPTYEHSNRLVWEVSPAAELPPAYVPTVTEHSGEAEPHTDSSFKKQPERYVALFAFRPARNGGLSEIVDGRPILEQLRETGSAELTILSSELFPFRVPTAFTRSRSEEQAEWIEAPVISTVPAIRYRHDVIERGFQCAPGAATRERRQAIEAFRGLVADAPRRIIGLETGDLLLTNNHEILHGRTAFEDKGRMLLRVRMDTDK